MYSFPLFLRPANTQGNRKKTHVELSGAGSPNIPVWVLGSERKQLGRVFHETTAEAARLVIWAQKSCSDTSTTFFWWQVSHESWPRFKGREIKLYLLMRECQGHTWRIMWDKNNCNMAIFGKYNLPQWPNLMHGIFFFQHNKVEMPWGLTTQTVVQGPETSVLPGHLLGVLNLSLLNQNLFLTRSPGDLFTLWSLKNTAQETLTMNWSFLYSPNCRRKIPSTEGIVELTWIEFLFTHRVPIL